MTILGCDISAVGQGAPDFDALKASGIRFVMAKATEGVGFVDSQFARSRVECARVNIRFGGYHFARPDLGNSAPAEAAYFLSLLPSLGRDDLLALDYEVSYPYPVQWCMTWLEAVRLATGVSALIYLNQSTAHAYDWSPVRSAGYPLWLANYDGQPNFLPADFLGLVGRWIGMKQYTNAGTLAGIAGPVDLDALYDSADVTDDELWAALQRVYPGKLEEIVKPTVRVMLEADSETRAAVVGAVKEKLG